MTAPVLLLLSALSATPQVDAPWNLGLDSIYRLDLLPAYKRAVKIGAVTSYDRTEGNDDGFSGKYSFVRKEGDSLVLADLKGPGCIYRIHTPTPTDDPIEFYFDGESTPRLSLPLRQLFTGDRAPFLRPLVDMAGGGCYSYVPIPYAKSCKVVLRAKQMQFYDLNYATYPQNAPVKSYDASALDSSGLERARALLTPSPTHDLSSFNVPPGSRIATKNFETRLAPGKSTTIFESRRGGRISSLRLGPSEAFSGKARDVLLRITWDGEKVPAVYCPVGDFFGYAWGKPAMASALLGTADGATYCNLPMPFDRSAKIELVSLRHGGDPITVRGSVATADVPRKPYEGKFYAVWNRENPTTEGKPFTFLDMKGRGHLVGLALQAQGKESGNTYFFEGDDQTTIDGDLVVHGTGSEDFFNGGWYDVPGRWDGQMSRPLSGCLAYQRHLGRTGGYRFMLGDAYNFDRSILQTIEHAPERNQLLTDYCAVAYLYADRPPTQAAPTLSSLAVVDPVEIIFSADWTVPISSFAFADATLSRRGVPADGGQVRCLSLRAKTMDDFFGPPYLRLTCDLPAAGEYDVFIDAVKGPEGAKVSLVQDERPLGDAVDLYADKPTVARRIPLGTYIAKEGGNNLLFKIVGKNAAAGALGFDLVNIVCVRRG